MAEASKRRLALNVRGAPVHLQLESDQPHVHLGGQPPLRAVALGELQPARLVMDEAGEPDYSREDGKGEQPKLLGAWLVVSSLTVGGRYAALRYADPALLPPHEAVHGALHPRGDGLELLKPRLEGVRSCLQLLEGGGRGGAIHGGLTGDLVPESAGGGHQLLQAHLTALVHQEAF